MKGIKDMKFTKKHAFIISLAIILYVAVYANWKLQKNGDVLGEENSGRNLGEAVLVNNNSTPQNEYFTSAKISRQQSKDEAIETLKITTGSENATKEEKEKAQAQIIKIATNIDKEGKIEALLKAKGFADCITIIGEETVNVMVKTEGLTTEQIVQIKDAVVTETKFPSEKIIIVEVK